MKDGSTLMDGHVHLYPRFEPDVGLDAAASAFRQAVRSQGVDASPSCHCLMLVDPAGVDGFGRLERDGARGWSVTGIGKLTLEAVRRSDHETVVIVAGRQIRTESGLEVLAFFTRDDVPEGLSLRRSVEAALEAGAVPVLPWGFGKWWGRRGRRIEDFLGSALGRRVLVADSAVRPDLMPEPRTFDVARGLGIPVIAGSDPLPFSGEEEKIGRYGVILDGVPEMEEPAEALKTMLAEEDPDPTFYGRRENALTALGLQAAMQLRGLRRSRDDG